MAQHSKGSAAGTVTALRRPPVRQSVLVRSDRQHTFEVFVATIGTWWPVTPFSAGKDRVRDVTFERQPGGYTGGHTARAGPAFSAAWPPRRKDRREGP
jgi:hypothetical protein